MLPSALGFDVIQLTKGVPKRKNLVAGCRCIAHFASSGFGERPFCQLGRTTSVRDL
jgi:hypothetical protein